MAVQPLPFCSQLQLLLPLTSPRGNNWAVYEGLASFQGVGGIGAFFARAQGSRIVPCLVPAFVRRELSVGDTGVFHQVFPGQEFSFEHLSQCGSW